MSFALGIVRSGAIFRPRFPRGEKELRAMSNDGRPAKAAERPLATQDKRPLVLVVDDDEDIAASIADVLRGGGYDVAQAINGGEALTAAARDRPGLVLLDWRLPTEPAGSA